jgi:hypothetical protein
MLLKIIYSTGITHDDHVYGTEHQMSLDDELINQTHTLRLHQFELDFGKVVLGSGRCWCCGRCCCGCGCLRRCRLFSCGCLFSRCGRSGRFEFEGQVSFLKPIIDEYYKLDN